MHTQYDENTILQIQGPAFPSRTQPLGSELMGDNYYYNMRLDLHTHWGGVRVCRPGFGGVNGVLGLREYAFGFAHSLGGGQSVHTRMKDPGDDDGEDGGAAELVGEAEAPVGDSAEPTEAPPTKRARVTRHPFAPSIAPATACSQAKTKMVEKLSDNGMGDGSAAPLAGLIILDQFKFIAHATDPTVVWTCPLDGTEIKLRGADGHHMRGVAK